MKRKVLIFLLFAILPGCEKNSENLLISNIVDKTRYYEAEIFNKHNQLIYGKWKFISISGGIIGETYPPTYDYLEVAKYGIYGIIKDNTVRVIGKIILAKQDDTGTLVTFFPDAEYMINNQMYKMQVMFYGNDTLTISHNFMDGYSSMYERVK
jgi:hypothetical protein